MDPAPGLVVLTDTSVLINFLHLDRLDLPGKLPGYEFQVPDHVVEEIRAPGLRERMEEGLRSGFLSVLSITDMVEIESYARFHRTLGQGEAACLAVASCAAAAACIPSGPAVRIALVVSVTVGIACAGLWVRGKDLDAHRIGPVCAHQK